MIHDSLDGTTGRRVFTFALHPPLHVIAANEASARAWLASVVEPGVEIPLDLGCTDRGTADRTEISVWRDESRL